MAPSLDAGVESRLGSPEGERVSLIVHLNPDTEAAVECLRSSPAKVRDELPLGYYAVSIEDSKLQTLCDLDVVSSIEIDSEATIFESDFLSRPG